MPMTFQFGKLFRNESCEKKLMSEYRRFTHAGVGVSSNLAVSLYAVQPKEEGRLFQKAIETVFLSLTVALRGIPVAHVRSLIC